MSESNNHTLKYDDLILTNLLLGFLTEEADATSWKTEPSGRQTSTATHWNK